MKIQCDVCDKDEASFFCVADEAALCSACDHHVHHANKLAGKHHRLSFHQPPPKQSPLCDICQERRAFLFCQQDRAILCRECDIPIHSANEHTQKHTRFLLTGLQISHSDKSDDAVRKLKSVKESNNSRSVSTLQCTPPAAKGTTARRAPVAAVPDKINNADQLTASISSISDYLIETLPGWHVHDFLDPANSPSPYHGFYKNGESEKLPFWDGEVGSNMNAFSTERTGHWVPQKQSPVYQTQNQLYQSVDISFGSTDKIKEQFGSNNIKHGRKWSTEDNSHTVPQITPPSSAALKRSRTLW